MNIDDMKRLIEISDRLALANRLEKARSYDEDVRFLLNSLAGVDTEKANMTVRMSDNIAKRIEALEKIEKIIVDMGGYSTPPSG